ncbi:DUF1800 family protein [Photobacterium lutimaris]|uniref:N-acetylglucosamine binding protein A domain-containing protein n=1 Tax=Photobacterium lutimaris TaxID=388278 RepID=A0A2T3J2N6_9GAMM|nr:DUF1800 family protein [Photobacterium lutimaris]PSU35526.1 hypothetical protein C9I99_00455 [Photobacterium lutimaris]TDR78576.1 uncharacterized protein (DUF1800 family) [Photobacterium lutimaris]
MFFKNLCFLKKAIVVLLFQIIASNAYAVDLIDNGSVQKAINYTYFPYSVEVTVLKNNTATETFECQISKRSHNRKAQWPYHIGQCINDNSTMVLVGQLQTDGTVLPSKSQTENNLWAESADYSLRFERLDIPQVLDFHNASRLLERGTFGPTQTDISTTVGLTAEQWVEAQIATAPSYHLDEYLRIQAIRADHNGSSQEHRNYRSNAWWGIALNSEDQLRQRVAFALSQMVVVSQNDAGLSGDDQAKGLAIYYDILVEHAFGNYKDLIRDVTYSPAMGRYLTMAGNLPPDPENNQYPDENYARELLQLFALGEWKVSYKGVIKKDKETSQPIPAYTEADVQELARLFTGWDEDNGLLSPMVVTASNHDTDPKRILGRNFPGNETADEELERLLDILVSKRETAVFVSTHLIKQLVTSNPDKYYVERVARTFNNTQGDLAAVVKAILTDPQPYESNPITVSKAREPIVTMTALYRAFNSQMGDNYPHHRDTTLGYGFDAQYSPEGHRFSQGALAAPSVFNFFPAGYTPSGPLEDNGLIGPEFALYTSAEIPHMSNLIFRKLKDDTTLTGDIAGLADDKLILDYSAFTGIWTTDDKESFLNLLADILFDGSLSPQLELRLSDVYDAMPKTNHDNMYKVFWIAAMSPEFQIQE